MRYDDITLYFDPVLVDLRLSTDAEIGIPGPPSILTPTPGKTRGQP